MASKEREILKFKKTQGQFSPLFCPNPLCKNHFTPKEKFWAKNGWSETQKYPFVNQRYKCRSCQRQFSYNTFSFDFRKKLINLSPEILELSMNAMSNSSIARKLKVGELVVRNRLALLARQAKLFEKEMEPKINIKEAISYDGFETFSGSQFSPCG